MADTVEQIFIKLKNQCMPNINTCLKIAYWGVIESWPHSSGYSISSIKPYSIRKTYGEIGVAREIETAQYVKDVNEGKGHWPKFSHWIVRFRKGYRIFPQASDYTGEVKFNSDWPHFPKGVNALRDVAENRSKELLKDIDIEPLMDAYDAPYSYYREYYQLDVEEIEKTEAEIEAEIERNMIIYRKRRD